VIGPNDPVEIYLNEIQPAVIVSLELALRNDPSADVVVLASRTDDRSEVTTIPRALALAHLRASSNPRLVEVCERIEQPPALPQARWLVCLTPEFVSTSSVAVVRLDTGAHA
jgi:hypothetical protein